MQLAIMSGSLDNTKIQLNDVVKQAETTIHTEVQQVRDNIDEYIIISNKQFAAENDFVKYQLAGTFTLIGNTNTNTHTNTHTNILYKYLYSYSYSY